MGLFTRRRPAAADTSGPDWQPDGTGIKVAPGYEMDDDGYAGENAYGVIFVIGGAPDAAITVWLYVTYAAPDDPGDFLIGSRCDYSFHDGSRGGAWTRSLYGRDCLDWDGVPW